MQGDPHPGPPAPLNLQNRPNLPGAANQQFHANLPGAANQQFQANLPGAANQQFHANLPGTANQQFNDQNVPDREDLQIHDANLQNTNTNNNENENDTLGNDRLIPPNDTLGNDEIIPPNVNQNINAQTPKKVEPPNKVTIKITDTSFEGKRRSPRLNPDLVQERYHVLDRTSDSTPESPFMTPKSDITPTHQLPRRSPRLPGNPIATSTPSMTQTQRTLIPQQLRFSETSELYEYDRNAPPSNAPKSLQPTSSKRHTRQSGAAPELPHVLRSAPEHSSILRRELRDIHENHNKNQQQNEQNN